MTRIMGDAVTGSVATLLTVPGLSIVAPYVTGSGIAWTPDELAAAAHLPQATIDQGGQGAPVMSATIRDVEQFAWTVAAAVDRTGWTAARPTIYCNRNTLPAVLAAGWQGDLWLAIPGWQPGQPLPATTGCTVVAVQNDYSNPAFDLSAVLDPTWPSATQEETMLLIQCASGAIYLLSGGRLHHVTTPAAVSVYETAGAILTSPVDAAEEAALLVSFPPGQPVVTVPPITFPKQTLTGTIAPA